MPIKLKIFYTKSVLNKIKKYKTKIIIYFIFTIFIVGNFSLQTKSLSVIDLNLRKLELAQTTEEVQTGLMYRKNLCSNCGMIFKFEDETKRNFWMKNTLIPLDIVFIDSKGKINTIHKKTTPLREDLRYSSKEESKYVLEFRGGFSNQYNLQEGSYLNIDKLLNTAVDFDFSYKNKQKWF
jgi:uncharacterized membrane protein (UPF0127 family)